jgi:hypothetical protein
MPALDKGPKANCHGTALLASSAGIRQTPPAAKFGRQHQKLGPAPAVRHWRSCKILQVPTHPASNKILRIATDVVTICRRLLMGGCRARRDQLRVRSTRQSPDVEDRNRYVWAADRVLLYPQRYVPAAGDGKIWALFTTGPRKQHCTTSRHLGCYCTVLLMSHFRPGLRALPVASTSINTTFWNMYYRVQASKRHLLHSRWSIDVGIESQTPFSPDSLRKTPLPCSPISPERSRVFPIAGHHPWTNHSSGVGRGDLSIPAVRLLSSHTLTAQSLLQGMVFLSLLQYKSSANAPDLTRGIVRPCCQREEACACPV